MSQKDFVPDSYKNLRDWAENIADNIDTIANRIGWTTLLAAFKIRVINLRDQAQAVLDAQAALDTAIGQLDAAKENDLPEIRQDIANLKTTRGFMDGDAKTLGVLTGSSTMDPNTYQPGLNVEEKKGRNEIMAKKLGADSLNVYARVAGVGPFKLLASKRVRFPLDDDTPSADGKAEAREYQVIGVRGDDEFGQPSDIVGAVWRP